ncbi:MAG: hypothetical protein M3392_02260 [Actinomycetota bacterium]|nr:hypothetical protein [Actinomycetota bacterium]
MCVNDAAIYEIRVKGVLDSRWSEWFDGMTLSNDDISGETTLCGAVADQAALHGVLAKVHNLGLPLLSVHQREPEHPAGDQPTPQRSTGGEEECS